MRILSRYKVWMNWETRNEEKVAMEALDSKFCIRNDKKGMKIILFFVFVLLLLSYLTLIMNRDKLTFTRNNAQLMNVPRQRYQTIPLSLPKFALPTEGWYINPTETTAQEASCLIIVGGVSDKAYRLGLVDDILNVRSDLQVYVFDWFGYGKTQHLYTPRMKDIISLMKHIDSTTRHHSKRIWLGHCIGGIFLTKYAFYSENHMTSQNDRFFFFNSLINYYSSGVDCPRMLQWFAPALGFILPSTITSELDIRKDIVKIQTELKIEIFGLYARSNTHVGIDNGHALQKLIPMNHYYEVAKMRHTRFDLKNDQVMGFLKNQVFAFC